MKTMKQARRGSRRIPLIAGQSLRKVRGPGSDVLQILDAAGQVQLTICVTPEGPVVELAATGLRLQTAGDLTIEAGRVAIHGRQGLALTTGGDADIAVEGDLETSARIQNITATLGNVNVRANDDVRLNGERVMMNC